MSSSITSIDPNSAPSSVESDKLFVVVDEAKAETETEIETTETVLLSPDQIAVIVSSERPFAEFLLATASEKELDTAARALWAIANSEQAGQQEWRETWFIYCQTKESPGGHLTEERHIRFEDLSAYREFFKDMLNSIITLTKVEMDDVPIYVNLKQLPLLLKSVKLAVRPFLSIATDLLDEIERRCSAKLRSIVAEQVAVDEAFVRKIDEQDGNLVQSESYMGEGYEGKDAEFSGTSMRELYEALARIKDIVATSGKGIRGIDYISFPGNSKTAMGLWCEVEAALESKRRGKSYIKSSVKAVESLDGQGRRKRYYL